jgi:hypothetical protein
MTQLGQLAPAAGQAQFGLVKPEHGVQLDRVGGDAALAVLEVEETDAVDRRRPGQ